MYATVGGRSIVLMGEPLDEHVVAFCGGLQQSSSNTLWKGVIATVFKQQEYGVPWEKMTLYLHKYPNYHELNSGKVIARPTAVLRGRCWYRGAEIFRTKLSQTYPIDIGWDKYWCVGERGIDNAMQSHTGRESSSNCNGDSRPWLAECGPRESARHDGRRDGGSANEGGFFTSIRRHPEWDEPDGTGLVVDDAGTRFTWAQTKIHDDLKAALRYEAKTKID